MSEIPERPETPPETDVNADIAQVRDLICRTHPDTVPELITGDTIADLIASIEPARQAYSRVAESLPNPVTVPAGGNTPVLVEADTLPISEKIRRGLAATIRRV